MSEFVAQKIFCVVITIDFARTSFAGNFSQPMSEFVAQKIFCVVIHLYLFFSFFCNSPFCTAIGDIQAMRLKKKAGRCNYFTKRSYDRKVWNVGSERLSPQGCPGRICCADCPCAIETQLKKTNHYVREEQVMRQLHEKKKAG
jgi:hypothetical protein